MFDVLTYEKGASVLRMVEQYLGPDTFRDGIRDYLDRHGYANTETSDLWAALDEVSDVPVSEVMDTWILQGGHPIVEVHLDGDSVSLSQRPLLLRRRRARARGSCRSACAPVSVG